MKRRECPSEGGGEKEQKETVDRPSNRVTIPKDATAAEIRRLVAWAQTLAVDYEGG